MEDFVNQMVNKTGIDRNSAEKVVNFLKNNADQIPKWLGQSGIADKLPGGLNNIFGGKKS